MNNRDHRVVVIMLSGVAAVLGAVLLVLGIAAAWSTGRQATLAHPLAVTLGDFTAVALAGLVLLAAIGGASWIVERGLAKTTEMIKDGAPYLPYVGASAGVLATVAAKPFDNDKTASAAYVIGVATAIVTVFAAKVIQKKPVWGIALFLVSPIVVVLIAVLTGMFDVKDWLSGLQRRDWVLIGVGTVLLFGVPATVGLVERWKGSPAWRFESLIRRTARVRRLMVSDRGGAEAGAQD
ncbi:MAG: hypothetical protein JWQ32_1327 [Marmoricola sp.]|nr:hypothetical protein [Marmoricola sp.]